MHTPETISAELHRLANIHPVGWNEADVREDIVAPLLALLGYQRGSDYDINREGSHLLSKPFLYVGRQRIDIDYALMVRKRSFWIIETKSAKDPQFDEQAKFQAHFYALHPDVGARYFAVCNGWHIEVFDIQSIDADYRPVLAIPLANLPSRFPELAQLLGASRVRAVARQQVLRDVRKLLEVEIREEAVDELVSDVRRIGRQVRPIIRENQQQVVSTKFRESTEGIREVVATGTPLQILRVGFQFPETPGDYAIVQNAFLQSLELHPNAERHQLLDKIGSHVLRARPTTTHRNNITRLVFTLLRRLEKIAPGYDAERLRSEVRSSIKLSLSDYAANPLCRALWLLEGNLHRALYKSAFVLLPVTKLLEQLVERKKQILQEEDLVYLRPSTSSERLAFVSDNFQRMYVRLSRLDVAAINEVNKGLVTFEQTIQADFDEAYRKRAGADLSFYAVYNRPFDYANSGLLAILPAGFHVDVAVVDDEIVELVESKFTQRSADYAVNFADVFLVRWYSLLQRIEVSTSVPADLAGGLEERFQRMHVARRKGHNDWRIWGRLVESESDCAEYLCIIDAAGHCLRVTEARRVD